MKDYARAENGGQIVMASCGDERFPPDNILDGKDDTFWMTTGMFPQDFIIKLENLVKISKITTLSFSIKRICVEKSEQENAASFEKVFETDLTARGDRMQTEVHQVNIKARFLRFSILSGHGEFATVNRVSVVGELEDGTPATEEF
uniref:F5/8 type C domain-containing protein n=1 Tax=Polytomella parva TaxID=51329 RepID=A0A7S0USI0_9CHLO|mmetsp:Transcript_20136/g.36171  ORF Transcript_20136/g.36171 Transcript_20136/m.36171 type:complete len:146 (+) Transcript_20136:53-490(+)